MKLIGISGFISDSKITLNTAYTAAFTRPGVTPLVIPELVLKNRELITQSDYREMFKEHVDKFADSLDALVLSGGGDLNPNTFEDENYASYSCDSIRDFMELSLLEAFLERKKPVMGICRGFQLIGRYLKLANFQEDLAMTGELHSGSEREYKSRQESCHDVMIHGVFKDYIEKAKGKVVELMAVNSWHHQGFTISEDGKVPKEAGGKKYKEWWETTTGEIEKAHNIQILACTRMVIEAFRHNKLPLFGVQWHPEEYGPDGVTIQYFIDSYLGK